jgi:hypothetical protein
MRLSENSVSAATGCLPKCKRNEFEAKTLATIPIMAQPQFNISGS